MGSLHEGSRDKPLEYLVFDEISIKRSENDKPMYDIEKRPQYKDRKVGIERL